MAESAARNHCVKGHETWLASSTSWIHLMSSHVFDTLCFSKCFLQVAAKGGAKPAKLTRRRPLKFGAWLKHTLTGNYCSLIMIQFAECSVYQFRTRLLISKYGQLMSAVSSPIGLPMSALSSGLGLVVNSPKSVKSDQLILLVVVTCQI